MFCYTTGQVRGQFRTVPETLPIKDFLIRFKQKNNREKIIHHIKNYKKTNYVNQTHEHIPYKIKL